MRKHRRMERRVAGLRRDIAAIAAFYGPDLVRARAGQAMSGPFPRLRLRLKDRVSSTESAKA